MKSSRIQSDIADPILYRTYYSLVLRDILYHLGYDTTRRNKDILHDFHKRILGYNTIAGRTQEVVSRFIFEVGVFWAERGIFVRMNRKQEIGIEEKPLSEVWSKL
jgi:hypothetical protein